MSVKSGFRVTNDLDYYRQQIESATIIAGGLQPETQVWYNRIIKNGGTISNADIATTDILMYQLNQASYRSKILYLMPFMGTVVKAWTVPLVDDRCWGIPNNTGTTAFVDGDGGTTIGVKGTGSAVLIFGTWPGAINGSLGGMGVYLGTYDGTGSTSEICGCATFTSATIDGRFVLDLRTSGTFTFFCWSAVANRTTGSVSATTNHHYYGQKSSNTLRSLWDNGSAAGTNNTTSDVYPNTQLTAGNVCLLGTMDQGTSSITYHKSTVRCFYITDGTLSSGDISALHTLLTTYLITATGR